MRRLRYDKVWGYRLIILLLGILCVVVLAHIHFNGNDWQDDSDDDYAAYSYYNKTLKEVPRFPFVDEYEPKWLSEKFPNEETRLVGISHHPSTLPTQDAKVIFLATKYFYEWNPKHYYYPHLGSETFKRYPCPINHCHVTNDRSVILKADAVLFHVRDLQIDKLPKQRHPNQIYILYSMEPPWLEILDFSKFDGYFNWTMSYRKSSDISVKYGFIGRKTMDSRIRKRPVFTHKRFDSKANKALWLVSNCCTDSNREGYVFQLMQHYPVEVFGGCGKEQCRPAETIRCYKMLAKQFKFYLAFENALCSSYITEKLYNVLEFNIIPVVFGGANYSEVLPPNSVINARDFSSPKELAGYLWKVSKDYTLYQSFFSWKDFWRAYLHPWMCDLCASLHQKKIKTSIKTDLKKWWDEDYSCQRWVDNEWISNKSPILPCFGKKLFQ